MSSALHIACFFAACMAACGAGICVYSSAYKRRKRKSRYEEMLSAAYHGMRKVDAFKETSGALRYACRLSREIASGKSAVSFSRLQNNHAYDSRFAQWVNKHAAQAGCANELSAAGFREASFRLMIAGASAGAVVGLVFSNLLSAVLCVVGALLGALMPFAAMRRAAKNRTAKAELHLSEMLQVVALGLRSGLSFDRSFELYGLYFTNSFSQSCLAACKNWTVGLKTRDEALKELGNSYNCEQLSRVIDSMLRSLRFGSSLVPTLEEASEQCRATYRARLEERVAKAPVKMMFPTGTLILPAMLMLVLGPVLLELMQSI